jgi:hypothetical protein
VPNKPPPATVKCNFFAYKLRLRVWQYAATQRLQNSVMVPLTALNTKITIYIIYAAASFAAHIFVAY